MDSHNTRPATDELTTSLNAIIRTVHGLVAHHENILAGEYDPTKTSDVSTDDLQEVEHLIEMAKDYCTR